MINIQELCLKKPIFSCILIKFGITASIIIAGAVAYGVRTGVWQNSLRYGLLLLSADILFSVSEYLHAKWAISL